jgi:hypothetical protein
LSARIGRPVIAAGIRWITDARIAAIALFAAAMLWPIAWVCLKGVSLSATYEESVGYRYFYTLRMLVEPNTFLFLPQGQSTDLVQKLIHLLLSSFGYPKEQIYPRVDYFSIASIFLFQTINIVAFASLILKFRGIGNSIHHALFWLVPSFIPDSSAWYAILMPDYIAVEPAISIYACALILDLYREPRWSRGKVVRLGLFSGVVAATKVTLAIFPAVVVLLSVLGPDSLRTKARYLALVVAVSAATLAVILFLDSGMRVNNVILYIKQMQSFILAGGGMQAAPAPWPIWILDNIPAKPLFSALTYAAPILSIIALFALPSGPKRRIACCLAVGSLLYSYVLYRRDYFVTLIEAGFFFWACCWCFWQVARDQSRVGAPAASESAAPSLALMLCMTALVLHWFSTYSGSHLAYLAEASQAEQQLALVEEEIVGGRLWLVPDNDSRPVSFDASLMKGGSGSTGIWLNPDSAFIRQIARNVDYRFERNDQRPVSTEDYGAILFMSPNSISERVAVLSKRYNIDLGRWNCTGVTEMETGTATICTPPAGGQ